MNKTIEFFSTINGVYDLFPIVDSKECIPDWMYNARKEVSDSREPNITRCPGIVDIFNTGYIVKSWHDIEVICAADKITVTIPDKQINDLYGSPPIQIQHQDGISKHIPKRPWSQKSIIKINTPWHLMAPKGLKFIIIPIPYSEDFVFESSSGILDPSISSEINIQGYWNVPFGKQTLKAGTPIAQIIPLSSEKYNMVCRDATERDMKWVNKRPYFNNFSFLLQRNKIKEAYEKHNERKCPFHFWK
jgi:hypothetical protein